jgi:hypothetical protein
MVMAVDAASSLVALCESIAKAKRLKLTGANHEQVQTFLGYPGSFDTPSSF